LEARIIPYGNHCGEIATFIWHELTREWAAGASADFAEVSTICTAEQWDQSLISRYFASDKLVTHQSCAGRLPLFD
jgi:hypothetical protein